MTRKSLSRDALAKPLEEWAASLRSGEPIRVGGVVARIPERVAVEVDLESEDGKAELELEIGWPAGALEAVDGAKNAAFLAARILALKYPESRARLDEATAAERARYDKARVEAELRFGTDGAPAALVRKARRKDNAKSTTHPLKRARGLGRP